LFTPIFSKPLTGSSREEGGRLVEIPISPPPLDLKENPGRGLVEDHVEHHDREIVFHVLVRKLAGGGRLRVWGKRRGKYN